MQVVQSPINTFIYMIISLFFSFLITWFIIKYLKFKNYELKLINIRYSAIISLIIGSIIIIIMAPLILLFIKSLANQLKISSNSGIGVIIFIFTAILEIAPVIIVVVLRKERLNSLGISKKNIFKSIFIGFISYLIYFMFIVLMKHKLKYIFPVDSLFSIWNLLNLFFTAFGEEILFRGYIQNRLMKWLGDRMGLIITTIFFCFSHITQRMLIGNMNIIDAIISSISLFPVALFLGYLFLKCKNVTAPTIFHTFYNFFQNYL